MLIVKKVNINKPERLQWRHYGAFIVNFKYISHLFLVFLMLLWTGKCLLGVSIPLTRNDHYLRKRYEKFNLTTN